MVGSAHEVETRATNVKITVSMPADMLAALKVIGFQRGSATNDRVAVAELVREAIAEWLEREIDCRPLVSIQL